MSQQMATSDVRPSAKRWLPLEANPDVMNQVTHFLNLIDIIFQILALLGFSLYFIYKSYSKIKK